MESIVPQKPVEPALLTIAMAMRLQFHDKPAALRAVDRALEILQAGLTYEFDGVELGVESYSQHKVGGVYHWYVTDGTYCPCQASRMPWCRHRMLFRLLFTQMAMADPFMLKMKIVEQCVPADAGDMPDNFLDYQFA